ncbi:Intermediate transcription factor (VITF-3L) [Eptesipox virus]|uniref:Intermediate transcription factor 3 large subunit n=1 Tax=Eptesipox virus TaxID=1329402 RepID=A0A220T6H5_9POXV|nr:Intermediate transcription factor (VITF-3L) [Eptesipox virus]ASK51321.1 Intermediate transcription factor (VITF-3L) [Eptesipox virus]WAH71079.1 intermediate transcription factor VITF-3L [Eptesipox virus]
MNELFNFLHEIENNYIRTLFNFHLIKFDEVKCDIYLCMKECISNKNIFDKIVTSSNVKKEIKKLVYCDINLTKHIINKNAYPNYLSFNHTQLKCSQFFDINVEENDTSLRTLEIFEHDKSSIFSYIKTTNKKRKIDYGEIKKTVHSSSKHLCNYFSGKKSDDFLSTVIRANVSQPWIKTISKRMRVDICNDSIITRGKSSILQTMEIVFTNRTCVKIFKDSTMHFILSKDKTENGCIDLINKLFLIYNIMFTFMFDITQNEVFKTVANISKNILDLDLFEDKLNFISKNNNIYGIKNFKIGMFNLTYKHNIDHSVFPSLLDEDSKIKFFKGKKLNMVALKSLNDCKKNVEKAEHIMKIMKDRSAILNKIKIESESVEVLKELISLK